LTEHFSIFGWCVFDLKKDQSRTVTTPLDRFRQNNLQSPGNYTLFDGAFLNFGEEVSLTSKVFKYALRVHHCTDFAKIICNLLVIIPSLTEHFSIFGWGLYDLKNIQSHTVSTPLNRFRQNNLQSLGNYTHFDGAFLNFRLGCLWP